MAIRCHAPHSTDIEMPYPTFDWTGGRSGRLLSLQEAQALESLWQKYFNENADKADGVTMNAIKLYN
ncbi:MAG: hypothetical protein J6A70_03220 [Prevotella sp.]|nr:hypothetical protein [Prevotella sp.]MBQ4633577.1 hypothetical protein [Prevotella sp.]